MLLGFVIFLVVYLAIGIGLMKLLIMKFGLDQFQERDWNGEPDNHMIFILIALWPVALVCFFGYLIILLIKKILGL